MPIFREQPIYMPIWSQARMNTATLPILYMGSWFHDESMGNLHIWALRQVSIHIWAHLHIWVWVNVPSPHVHGYTAHGWFYALQLWCQYIGDVRICQYLDILRAFSAWCQQYMTIWTCHLHIGDVSICQWPNMEIPDVSSMCPYMDMPSPYWWCQYLSVSPYNLVMSVYWWCQYLSVSPYIESIQSQLSIYWEHSVPDVSSICPVYAHIWAFSDTYAVRLNFNF